MQHEEKTHRLKYHRTVVTYFMTVVNRSLPKQWPQDVCFDHTFSRAVTLMFHWTVNVSQPTIYHPVGPTCDFLTCSTTDNSQHLCWRGISPPHILICSLLYIDHTDFKTNQKDGRVDGISDLYMLLLTNTLDLLFFYVTTTDFGCDFGEYSLCSYCITKTRMYCIITCCCSL